MEQVTHILLRSDEEQREGKFNIALCFPSAFLLLVKSTLFPSPPCCLIHFCILTGRDDKRPEMLWSQIWPTAQHFKLKTIGITVPLGVSISLRHNLAHLFIHKCTINIQRRLSKHYCLLQFANSSKINFANKRSITTYSYHLTLVELSENKLFQLISSK